MEIEDDNKRGKEGEKEKWKRTASFSDLEICVRTVASIFIDYHCESLRHTSKEPVWNEVREGLQGREKSGYGGSRALERQL